MKIDLVKLVEEVYKLEGEPKNVNKVFALICLQAFKEQLTFSCTELRDKETPKIEDWLKDNFKRLDRHSFTNTHEDTVWLRSELVEVYNQLHP